MTKNRGKPSRKEQRTERPPVRGRWLLWLGAILVLTFAVYLPSLDNDFTNWDDNQYITGNPLLAHPSVRAVLTTPVVGNYHPLTVWSLALNYRISGLNPASYHWLSLLLHLANTALVFLFIRRLSGGRLWTSVVTSLFFGIHPMHVESVAWIAERKDVLYAFFYLIGLIAYLRYLDRRRLPWLGVSLFAFVLSVASKPAAVVFPVTLLAIDWYRRRAFNLSVMVEKVPFFAVSLAGGILTLMAQQAAGAIADQWSPFQKLLFASYGTLMYVAKLFVPVRLSAIYPYPIAGGRVLGPEFYFAFAVVAILLPTVVYLCRRNRVVLFGLVFFFINIALVLQLFTVGQAVMADRYTYLPYIGLFFSLAWWLDERPGSILGSLPAKAFLAGSLLLLLSLCLIQTWRRCDVWQNAQTLWNDAIQKYPRSAHVWYDEGVAMAEANDTDSAYVYFDRAIDLEPKFPEALNNRGAIKLSKGDLAGAVSDFSYAIALNTRYRSAYTNRALAYAKMHEYEKSIVDSRRAIELDPKHPDNYLQYVSIGWGLEQLNRNDSAFVCFDRAIELNPNYADALNNRGAIKLWKGDLGGAVADFSRAIVLNPRFWRAYANRALAYARMREYEKSIVDSRRAIELDPKNPENYIEHGSIGEALQQLNRHREAIPEYDEAIRIAPGGDPRQRAYYLNRSFAWWALGDRGRALNDAREAQRLGARVEPAYLRRLGG